MTQKIAKPSDRKCSICNQPNADRAHWRHRRSFKKEERWTQDKWRYLCRAHHTEEGVIGSIEFAHKYGQVGDLVKSGYPLWRINEWRTKHKMAKIEVPESI